MAFIGTIRQINSAKLGPPIKEGYTQIDVIVDVNKDAPRAVVSIPLYSISQLQSVIDGFDPEISNYIAAGVFKASRGEYQLAKGEEPPKIAEILMPSGSVLFRIIYQIMSTR